jgi:hypothetical protein
MIEKGLKLAQTHRVLYFQCLWLYLLAQAHLWNKDPVEAAAVASRVMELAPSMGEVADLPWGQLSFAKTSSRLSGRPPMLSRQAKERLGRL